MSERDEGKNQKKGWECFEMVLNVKVELILVDRFFIFVDRSGQYDWKSIELILSYLKALVDRQSY